MALSGVEAVGACTFYTSTKLCVIRSTDLKLQCCAALLESRIHTLVVFQMQQPDAVVMPPVFSIQILRSQHRWIGHILRCPETDPLRLVVFEFGTDLCPRLTNTGRKRVVGRPRIDWAEAVIDIFAISPKFPDHKCS